MLLVAVQGDSTGLHRASALAGSVVALLIGSFTTILGALLGFYAGHLKDAGERKDRRAILATALLVELRWLNGVLRQVAGGGVPQGDPFDHPVLEATMRELGLFDRSAAANLVHFRSLVLDVRNDARAAHEAQEPDSANAGLFYVLNASVKAKATFAANAIKDLKETLLASGGEMPPPIRERPGTLESLPQLLPSAFQLFDAPEPDEDLRP